jgi:uncharacterized protein YjbI with pentapeptide repeats
MLWRPHLLQEQHRRVTAPSYRESAQAHAFWVTCWAALFLGMLTTTSTLNAAAQDPSMEQEAKARLSMEELRARLQGGESIQSSVIQGDDLIALLRERTFDPTVEITIADSVIEGRLDFTTLPAILLERVERPKRWITKDREAWIARNRSARIDKIHVVANPIRITASTILPRPQNGQNADSIAINAKATFFDMTTFGKSIFRGRADFGGATFGERANFRDTTFRVGAVFGGATFRGRADFWRATFEGEAAFRSTRFNEMAGFGDTTFGVKADFEDTIFGGRADFLRATFSGEATFRGATFSGEATFRGATFSGEAAFGGARFSGRADFGIARFAKLAFFKDAGFFGRLTLENALFETYADFRDTRITQMAFNNVTRPQIMNGRMDFRRTTITEADFQDIVFERDINYSDARFGYPVEAKGAQQQGSQTSGDTAPRAGQPQCPQVARDVATMFRFVTFEGHAYFLRAVFCGRTSLEHVIFQKDADFTDATFQDHQDLGRPGFSLSYVNFTTLRLKWSQLAHPASWVQNAHQERIESFLDREKRKTYEALVKSSAQAGERKDTPHIDTGGEPLQPLSEVFKSLETNFRRQNELEDANEAYYQMRRAELKEARERQSFWERGPLEAKWLLLGIPCGYGTAFGTVVSLTLGVNVFFTLIYWARGDLQRHRNPEIKQDFTFKQRLLELPHLYITAKDASAKPHNPTPAEPCMPKVPTRDVAKFRDALRFSSVLLFKIGYRDTTVSEDLCWIVTVEWVLGFYRLALLIYTLTNTQPLLNNLIQGVF